MSDASIEQVGIAPNEIVAELWRQVLRDEGIIALLKPAGLGHAYVPNDLNPHYILVRVDQADLAREVIASLSEDWEDDTSSDSTS